MILVICFQYFCNTLVPPGNKQKGGVNGISGQKKQCIKKSVKIPMEVAHE